MSRPYLVLRIPYASFCVEFGFVVAAFDVGVDAVVVVVIFIDKAAASAAAAAVVN